MAADFQEYSHTIPGPAGTIELIETCPHLGRVASHLGVVCHPHPLHGGTMNNKVVQTVVRAFRHLGLDTLRFNFRGVGASEGIYDHGNGETQDLLAVLDWARAHYPKKTRFWLAGFSFGSCVAARVAAQWKGDPMLDLLLTVAPPISSFDFHALIPDITCPWVIVHGEQDALFAISEVKALAQAIPGSDTIWMEEAGHFFHRRLIALRERLTDLLHPYLSQQQSL